MATRTNKRSRHADDENPEWSRDEVRNAKPALAVVAEIFGSAPAEALKRPRGRPAKPDKKINQTLRLDPDVLHAYRHLGSGWQTRINEVLRQHMPKPGK